MGRLSLKSRTVFQLFLFPPFPQFLFHPLAWGLPGSWGLPRRGEYSWIWPKRFRILIIETGWGWSTANLPGKSRPKKERETRKKCCFHACPVGPTQFQPPHKDLSLILFSSGETEHLIIGEIKPKYKKNHLRRKKKHFRNRCFIFSMFYL